MGVLSAMVFGWSRGSVEPPLAAGNAAPKPVGWPGNQSAVRVASGLDLQRCSRMHGRIAPRTSNSGQSGSNEKVFVVGASRRSAAPGNQFIDRFAHTTSCALRQRWWRGPQILSSPLASTKRRRHSWHAWRQSQPLVASTAPNRHVQRNLRVNA